MERSRIDYQDSEGHGKEAPAMDRHEEHKSERMTQYLIENINSRLIVRLRDISHILDIS